MALSKTGRFLSKAEILGVGVFSPLPRVGQTAAIPRREGTNLGVFVPVWLVLPQSDDTHLGVFDLCHCILLKRGRANSGEFRACWAFCSARKSGKILHILGRFLN